MEKIKRVMYLDSVFEFGQHAGLTLSAVRRKDRDYIEWCKVNIPDIEFRNRLHPVQHHPQNDDWKKVDPHFLRRWATPGHRMKPQNIDGYIDFT